MGACLNLVSYWCLGAPVALLLGFRAHMGVTGFWLGIATATLAQAGVLVLVLSRFDWQLEVARARALAAEQAPLLEGTEAEEAQEDEEAGSKAAGAVVAASGVCGASTAAEAQQPSSSARGVHPTAGYTPPPEPASSSSSAPRRGRTASPFGPPRQSARPSGGVHEDGSDAPLLQPLLQPGHSSSHTGGQGQGQEHGGGRRQSFAAGT